MAQREIWEREHARREAIWRVTYIEPGSPLAFEYLDALDQIDLEDELRPLGSGADLSPSDLLDLVKIHHEKGRIDYVLEGGVPEPWRERMNQASTGSTRPVYGWYACDWLKFLGIWDGEMDLLRRHRAARLLRE